MIDAPANETREARGACINADGSTSVMTLAEAGITEINLTADATYSVLTHGLTSNNIFRIFEGFF